MRGKLVMRLQPAATPFLLSQNVPAECSDVECQDVPYTRNSAL